MKIDGHYSHLNGLEYLMVHRPSVWDEVKQVIQQVDAAACKTKRSKERGQEGRLLYSPKDLNRAFKAGFESLGWKGRQRTFWVTNDDRVLRNVHGRSADEQKRLIREAGKEPIRSYNQTDFVKERVAVEVQFGKYAFVAHDLFVKHLSFFVSDVIDVGIEILPMKSLEREMSSGVPYYERDLLNVIRQGRGVPAVPLVLVGIEP